MDYVDIRTDGASDAIFVGRAELANGGTITDGVGFENVLVLKRVINTNPNTQSG